MNAQRAGAILSGALACVRTLAGDSLSGFGKVVLAALTAGVGAFVASLQGAWRAATGQDVVQFRIGAERRQGSSSLPDRPPLVLSYGGSFADLNLFAGENQAMTFLTQRLGPPDNVVDGLCEATTEGGRRATWDELTVIFADEVPDFPFLDGYVGPVIVGWEYWKIKTGGDGLGLKTREGLGLGSAIGDVMRVHPDAESSDFLGTTYLNVFYGDASNMGFAFDEAGFAIAIDSGQGCGE